LARQWGSREEREKLDEDIRKLFTSAWSGSNSARVQEEWGHFREKVSRTTGDLQVFVKIFERADISKRERALMRLFFYLVAVEGGFVNHMNFVCMLLVLEGHDLFNFVEREYARSYQDITKVDTYSKSLFLNEHGLMLFNKGLSRSLRNAIAHHDFEIDEEGDTTVGGHPTDLVEKNFQIIDFLNLTSNSLKVAAKECFKWDWEKVRKGK